MPELDQIRESIEARIAELKNEITSLQAARSALQAAARRAATPPGAPQRAAKPRRRRTRATGGPAAGAPEVVVDALVVADAQATPTDPASAASASPVARRRSQSSGSRGPKRVEVTAGDIEAMLHDAENGLSATAIAKRANAGYNRTLTLLRELERTGRVTRTGARRTSLWRVITDEERIAARVAELERLRVAEAETLA